MNPTTPQPVATPPAPQPAAPGVAAGGKKMNKGLLAGIIAAIVLVIAGGAWAVYALFFAATPESLIKDALKNLGKEKSIAVDFDVSGQGASLTGSLAALTDDTDKNGEVILTLGEGSQSISLSLLTVDGDLFVKGTNIEQIAPIIGLYSGNMEAFSSPEFIAALGNLNNIWFEISKEQLDSLLESSGESVTTATTSPQDVKKVLDLYEKHPFVKADKVFADETINGAKSAHFSVTIDKQQEAVFLDELKKANLETVKITDETIADIKEATASQTSVIELWIARDTKKLTKVLVSGEVEGQEVKVSFTRSASTPTFDKLERPADAKPISELMSILLGSSMTPGELQSFNATDLMY